MISLTVSHVGGILIVIIFPPTSLSFMDPSVVVGKVWSYSTTYSKHVLIGWEPTVASEERAEVLSVEKELAFSMVGRLCAVHCLYSWLMYSYKDLVSDHV